MSLPDAYTFYVGSDLEYFKQVSEGVDALVGSVNLIYSSMERIDERFFAGIIENRPNLIIFDLDDIRDYSDLERCLNYLKNIYEYNKIFVLAIFTDSIHEDGLFLSGVNFTYCKNNEPELLSSYIAYLIFRERIAFKKVAIADRIFLKTSFLHRAGIGEVGDDCINLGTDIDPGSELVLKQTMLEPEELHFSSFDIFNISNFGQIKTIRASWPLKSGWGDEGQHNLHEDTLNTFLKRIRTDDLSIINFLSIGLKLENIQKFLNDSRADKMIFKDIPGSLEIFKDEVLCNKASVIFINFQKFKEESSLNLEEYFECVKGIFAYKPIFLIYNSPSTSEALAKLFDYPKVLAFNSELSFEILSELTDLLLAKKTVISSLFHQLSFATAYIEVPVTINSISEQEIIFESNYEIPYYTILKVPQFENFYLLIVPPYYDTKKSNEKFTYVGFIFGQNDMELQKLRYFINQIIFKPLDTFDEDSIKAILEGIKEEPPLEEEGEKKSEASDNESVNNKEQKKYELVIDKNWKSKF